MFSRLAGWKPCDTADWKSALLCCGQPRNQQPGKGNMSSLPFISHRLFVAAIGTEVNGAVKAARNETASRSPSEPAADRNVRAPLNPARSGTAAIALEVMDCGRVTVEAVGRGSRAAVGRVGVGVNNAGETPGVAGGTPAPLPGDDGWCVWMPGR